MSFLQIINRYPVLEECLPQITNAFDILVSSFEKNGKLLLCGNGGSAADCDHLTGELMKGFLKKRPLSENEKLAFSDEYVANNLQKGLKTINLCSQSALMTAFANDVEADLVFAQQVYAYAEKNDVLLVFSTSGNSKNIVYAAKTAKAMGIKLIAITGKNESELSKLCDVCIRLPETDTYKIQELTLPVYHGIAAAVEESFFEV